MAIFALLLNAGCSLSADGAVQNLVDENWQFIYNRTVENKSNDIKDTVNKTLQEHLPGAKILSFEEIEQNNTSFYRCSVSYQSNIIDLLINPKTGAITGGLQSKPEPNPDKDELTAGYIDKNFVKESTEEINNILKQTMPGALLDKVKYNKKDNSVDGFVLYQDLKYYFKINAANGNILKMEPLN